MSQARVFTPENRLRHVLDDPTAPTAAELIAAAESNVAKLRPKLRGAIEHHCEELARLASRPGELSRADVDALGAQALAVCETAPACGLPAAAEAAKGLYVIVTALRGDGVWRMDVLHAHVSAILTLAVEPPPLPSEARAVLDRLHGLRAFVGAQA